MNPLRIVHRDKKKIEASHMSPQERQVWEEIKETMIQQVERDTKLKRKPKPNKNAS
jgi:hypothetical protein